MAYPEPDRGYVDEAKIAFGGLVVSGCNTAGVLELVEATLDQVSQPVQAMIHPNTYFAGLSHWNLGQDITFSHHFPNTNSVRSRNFCTLPEWQTASNADIVREDGCQEPFVL